MQQKNNINDKYSCFSSSFLFLSNQITSFLFIIGQKCIFNQSTNPIAYITPNKKKKKSIVSIWRVRTSFLSFFSRSHECIYLISRYIAIGRKKKTRTYIYIYETQIALYAQSKERERERWVIEKKSRWMHILSKESCSFAIFLFAYRFGHT